MRLLFIGCKISPDLKKILLANDFTVHEERKIPQSTISFDMIVLSARGEFKPKDLPRLRASFPDAWIAVLLKERDLSDSELGQALLEMNSHDDIWFEETWESAFWLSLKRAVHVKRTEAELSELKKECSLLKTQSAELSKVSKELIGRFENNVSLATNIQRNLLPKVSPVISGVSFAVKYIPSLGLGGDYYDIFEFGDRKRFGVLLVDSKTHGMAALLLSILFKVRLEEMKERFPESKSFVEYLNHEIQAVNTKELSSLNLLYGIFDRSSLTFQYTSAGKLHPFLWRLGERTPIGNPSNPPLGGVDHFAFREHYLKLKPGDLLLLFTDGLESPLTEPGMTAEQKLESVLKTNDPSPDPLDLQNEVMALVDRYVEGKELEDDLTLLQLSINERAIYVADENPKKVIS